jgi:hypothetical protein
MPLDFHWTTFDLNDQLPVDWQHDIAAAADGADFREFKRTPVISRYGVVLNVQRGNTMRFECHVDSNPLTVLLFCTDESYPESTRPPELNRHLDDQT